MNIDELVKQQLDGFEVPMPESSLARLNQNLDQMAKPSGSAKWPWIAAGILVTAGITALLLTTGGDDITLAEDRPEPTKVEKVLPITVEDEPTDKIATEQNEKSQSLNHQPVAEHVVNRNNEDLGDTDPSKTIYNKDNKEPKSNPTPKPEDVANKPSIPPVTEGFNSKPLEVSVLNAKDVYCVGDVIKLDIQGAGGKDSYVVKVTGGPGQLNGTVFTPFNAGKYQIEVFSPCCGDNPVLLSSATIPIIVEQPGLANINVKYNDFASRPLHTFSAAGDIKKGSATWVSGDKTIQGEQAEFFFKTKGMHEVTLQYTSENGCVGKVKELVYVDENYNLLAPNSISLSVHGKDVFMPKALTAINLPFTLSIISQAGTLVYQTTDATRPWDGMRQDNGTMARQGEIYIWKVILTNEKGLLEEYGDVIVIAP